MLRLNDSNGPMLERKVPMLARLQLNSVRNFSILTNYPLQSMLKSALDLYFVRLGNVRICGGEVRSVLLKLIRNNTVYAL